MELPHDFELSEAPQIRMIVTSAQPCRKLTVDPGVIPEEQREQVTRTDPRQRATGGTRSRGKTAVFRGWHEPDKRRGLSPVQ